MLLPISWYEMLSLYVVIYVFLRLRFVVSVYLTLSVNYRYGIIWLSIWEG